MANSEVGSRQSQTKIGSDSSATQASHTVDTEKFPGDFVSGVPSFARDAEMVTPEYVHGIRLTTLVIATLMSSFLIQIDQTILATAIPKITDEFLGLDNVSWYSSAYFMTFGAFQSSWGKNMKYFPLKTSFLLATFIFEIGSLICAVAPNATTLIIGRAIAGFGGAGIMVGSVTIMALVVEPKKRPQYMSLFGALYGVASITGPLLGGVFSDRVSWRWCFYINLPIGGLSIAMMVFFFHTPRHIIPVPATLKEKILQMDLVGVVMVMGGIVAYILALQFGGNAKPWNSSVVIGMIVGFVALLVAFSVWERFQGDRAMIVPRLFKLRAVWVGCIYQFFFAGGYFISLYYLPVYFQSVDNTSAIESGVRNLAMILMVPIAAVGVGVTMTKTGLSAPIMLLGSTLGAVSSGLFYTFDIGTPMGQWIGYQVIAGMAFGGAFQVPLVTAQAAVQPEDMSSASAMIFFFQTIGGSFCISAAQSGFINKIASTLAFTVPEVNLAQVIATGATQIRTTFTTEQVPGVVIAYMAGLKVAFAIMAAVSGFSFFVGLCASWKRIHSEVGKEAAHAG